jgi:hypothetical protein
MQDPFNMREQLKNEILKGLDWNFETVPWLTPTYIKNFCTRAYNDPEVYLLATTLTPKRCNV